MFGQGAAAFLDVVSAPAVAAYEVMRQRMGELGVEGQRHLDLWTGLIDGLTDQQITNEPGGDRWAALVDDAVDMWHEHVVRSGVRR